MTNTFLFPNEKEMMKCVFDCLDFWSVTPPYVNISTIFHLFILKYDVSDFKCFRQLFFLVKRPFDNNFYFNYFFDNAHRLLHLYSVNTFVSGATNSILVFRYHYIAEIVVVFN